MSLRFIGFLPHCYRVSATKENRLTPDDLSVPFDTFLTPNSINQSPTTHPLRVPRIPRKVHNMQVSPLALGQAASPFIATLSLGNG